MGVSIQLFTVIMHVTSKQKKKQICRSGLPKLEVGGGEAETCSASGHVINNTANSEGDELSH